MPKPKPKPAAEQAKLEVHLKRDSLQLHQEGFSSGELVFVVENKELNPVACDRIRLYIPYGDKKDPKALTNSNEFPSSIRGDWNLNDAPPYRLNEAKDALLIDVFNDYSTISSKGILEFYFTEIPIIPNSAGTETRIIPLKVEIYNSEEETLIFSKELSLTLKVPIGPPPPYVNYFVSNFFRVDKYQTLSLQWDVSNGNNIVLYPIFLGDRDHRPSTQKQIDEDVAKKPGAEEVITIYDENPIPLDQKKGTLEVRLVRSTLFKLVADDETNRGVSELLIFLKDLVIIYFETQKRIKHPIDPAEELVLHWMITFPGQNPKFNKALLIGQEFDNSGTVMPLVPGSIDPPSGIKATWVQDVPEAHLGQFTVFPTRPTKYVLFIAYLNSSGTTSKTQSTNIMIKTPNTPIGSFTNYLGKLESIPYGWAFCDGSKLILDDFINHWSAVYKSEFGKVPPDYKEYLIQSFRELSAILSGSDTEINKPNLQNKFITGAGDQYQLHNTGGVDVVTLTEPQMPPHKHTGNTNIDGKHWHNNQTTHRADNDDNDEPGNYIGKMVDGGGYYDGLMSITDFGSEHGHSFTTDSAGGNDTGGTDAHENRPPYYASYYIIKVLK